MSAAPHLPAEPSADQRTTRADGSTRRQTGHDVRPVYRNYKVHVSGAFTFLGVLAIGGYAGDWSWTGFRGNTVWDWLHLLILPVVLSVLPLWLRTRSRLELRWRAGWALAAGTLSVLAIGGYALDWSWTGFRGNTAWDWMQLLLVPFVLPAVLTHLTNQPQAETAASQPADRDPSLVG